MRHLTIDHDDRPSQHDQEFIPLPFYTWDERPIHVPLDHDECATAIHLAQGDLPRAASLLKVAHARLSRLVTGSPRLQRIRRESLDLVTEKAESKVIASLDAQDARRQEWAVNTILRSKLGQNSPLSPAPAASLQSSASVTVSGQQKSYTFRWRTAADPLPSDDSSDEPDTSDAG
jgi:hypothetical protein